MLLDSNSNSKYYSLERGDNFHKRPVSALSEVWECLRTGAKSLHASVRILPGNVISEIGSRDIVQSPNYLSVQIDSDKHILLNPIFLQYINHSCDPNVFFDTDNMKIICLKDITVGEAISFFYPSTEWSMSQSFQCLCGSKKCLGTIQGARYVSLDILARYDLSSHIQKKVGNKV